MLGSAAAFIRSISHTEQHEYQEVEAIFEIEIYGQDQSVVARTPRGRQRRTLTQYKYSMKNRKIAKQEMISIARALRRGAREAKRVKKITTDLFLCTNRNLTGTAESERLKYEIGLQRHDPQLARELLKTYAAKFGFLSDEEIEKGVGRIMNRFIETATGGSGSRRINRRAFDQALTGWESPRYLSIPELCHELAEELDSQQSSADVEGVVLATREKVVEAVEGWTNEALIFFTGDGGSGKTTALWQILRNAVDPVSSPRRLTCLLLSAVTPPQTLEGLVDRWRGSSGASSIRDDLALERLKVANPSALCPVLIIGLDGIDEAGHWISSGMAGRLITLFWNLHQKHMRSGVPPPARLLVSCRHRDEIGQFFAGMSGTEGLLRFVDLGQFTTSEFEWVLQQTGTVDSGVAKRIIDAGDVRFQGYSDGRGVRGGLGVELPENNWISLLHQPIIWRFFTLLSPAQQLALIGGDETAEDAIAAHYLKWFRSRTRRRLALVEDMVEDALRITARKCDVSMGPFEFSVWLNGASASCLQPSQGRMLHCEGIGAGFIDVIPPTGSAGRRHSAEFRWLWRYQFFWRYLRGS
jgi:hypothetical protein